jgi:hypothetical protein
MESTSIYWHPVWWVLESDFSLKLANPYFFNQLKSDVKDAHWIAQCLQKDLISSSFVLGGVLQQMQQLTCQCRRLTKSRVRFEQQMDDQLQRCNIRFSNYVSNQGNNVSLRKIIKAVIGRERYPAQLNRQVHGRIRSIMVNRALPIRWNFILNRIALNLLKNEKTIKVGWDNQYLIKLLKNQMRQPWENRRYVEAFSIQISIPLSILFS